MPSPSAAVERAGVERGDPLALRQLLTVRGEIDTGGRVVAPHLAAQPAAADEPVADDRENLAADDVAVGESPAGENSALVEHERKARLSRWQAIGSQR